MSLFSKALLVACAALSEATALAQTSEPVPACAAPGTLPPELAAWARPHQPIIAAAKATGLKAATLTIGSAADATLQPTPAVTFPVNPAKPGGSASHGGLFTFEIARAGIYRVALGSGAWVDVIAGGAVFETVAHGHGPDCTGLRKMVDYALGPGRYILQVSANDGPALAALIVRRR